LRKVKVVLLVLPLLVMAVSCASVPQHAGGDQYTGEGLPDAVVPQVDDQYDVDFPLDAEGDLPEVSDALPGLDTPLTNGDISDAALAGASATEGLSDIALAEALLAGDLPDATLAEVSTVGDLIALAEASATGDSTTQDAVLAEAIAENLPDTASAEAFEIGDISDTALVEASPATTDTTLAEGSTIEDLLDTALVGASPIVDLPDATLASPIGNIPDTALAEVSPVPDIILVEASTAPDVALIEASPVLHEIHAISGPVSVSMGNPNTGSTNTEPVPQALVPPEPISPVFIARATNPNTGNPNTNTSPVSPDAIVQEPAPVIVVPPPVAIPSVVAWEPPVFEPDLPELPNPVSDFRNLLPPPPAFSRVVHVPAGQMVEIPFRGSGWIFLGETGGQRGISFDVRRPDSDGQTFVFRAETEGEYSLRFYRRDFVRDIILNDHVQIVVETGGAAAGRVIAERWPSPIDEARILRATGRLDTAYPVEPIPQAIPELAEVPAPVVPIPVVEPVAVPEPIPAVVTAAPPVVPNAVPYTIAEPVAQFLDPFELLQMARDEFDAGRVAEAIALLDLFTELYPSGSDEAWWLYGQFFEADSPSRNILYALSYYRRLVNEFPQSSRLTDARRRIAFLERFFINIR